MKYFGRLSSLFFILLPGKRIFTFGMKKKKINIVTLGCSKNLVDSEQIMTRMAAAGYEPVFDSDSTDARTVIVNTCGFIGDAKEESIETILRFAQARSEGLIDRLYVIGCLSERYRDELRTEIPEVDEYFGARDLAEIVRGLGAQWRDEMPGGRIISTPPHYAYLKIAEGCNWGCGYCAIPLIRGRHVSVPMERLLDEARKLAEGGARELMVIAQDTTYYGLDLYGRRRLGELLRALCRIDGIEWIRLHYAYPAHFPEEVIEAMAEEPKICKYLDIPLQHISDSQLRAMRRGITREETLALVRHLREAVPGIALRTTLLVGYPGESEADFAELEEFVRRTRFERLGVFPYSEEEGTYSATQLSDNVPEEVKRMRAERIMEIQNNISREENVKRVGQRLRVIVDRREGEWWVARSQYDSPEVDEEILIPADRELETGRFYEVRVTGAEDYDLYAELF